MLAVGLILATAGGATAGNPLVEALRCLPNEANRALTATVPGMPAGAEIRLYFRRLNPSGAFYYNRMRATDDDTWWSVLPRPEDRAQRPLDDDWWQILEQRDWMQAPGRDRAWLERWLEEREHEAAEIYVAVHAPSGERLGRSEVQLIEVLPADECPTELDARENGWAENLTVGETTDLQAGRPLFHWLCEGIVTRISAAGIHRADGYCRPCVVGSHETRKADEAIPAL